jgi:hypothetical protein
MGEKVPGAGARADAASETMRFPGIYFAMMFLNGGCFSWNVYV